MRLANALVALAGPEWCAGCRAPGSALCPACRLAQPRPVGHEVPPGVDRIVAAFEYGGPVRDLVLALKLNGRRGAACPLAAAMCSAARTAGLVGTTVTWVPGRPGDIKVRGYDHAEVLATGVAAGLGLPATRALRRQRAVQDQSGLGAAERRTNLRGAFRARPVPGERLMVVDDLLTTGATAVACARALKAGGATGVELLVACRKS